VVVLKRGVMNEDVLRVNLDHVRDMVDGKEGRTIKTSSTGEVWPFKVPAIRFVTVEELQNWSKC